MEKNNNNKKFLIGALAVLLVAVAVGGTIAWLTSSDTVKNTFTVGTINDPVDTDKDEKPDNRPTDVEDDENSNLEGNLYEDFKDGSKVTPGATVTKTPYVVLGPNSEDAYVYVYVDNNTLKDSSDNATKAAYFTLGTGWKAVDAELYTGEDSTASTYTGGLFVYVGEGDTATPLKGATTNSWSPKVFENVTFPDAIVVNENGSEFAEEPEISVSCFIYSADGADTTEMEQAAKTWAGTLVEP